MQVPDTSAVWADFVHIRTVRGRKVCEIILETALDDLPEVLKRLGNPVGADCIPVALAPLDLQKVKEKLDVKPAQAKAKPEAAHKSFSELPLSQQAALRCKEPTFQEFLKRDDEAGAIDEVKLYCDVDSRSQIVMPSNAGAMWLQLEARYQSWLTDRKFAESKR